MAVGGLDRTAFGAGKVAVSCESADESSGALRLRVFLDYLKKDKIFTKDAAPPC